MSKRAQFLTKKPISEAAVAPQENHAVANSAGVTVEQVQLLGERLQCLIHGPAPLPRRKGPGFPIPRHG